MVESAVVLKKTYDDWFWEQASKIPVKIKDSVLKQELLKEVNWAKLLNLK